MNTLLGLWFKVQIRSYRQFHICIAVSHGARHYSTLTAPCQYSVGVIKRHAGP